MKISILNKKQKFKKEVVYLTILNSILNNFNESENMIEKKNFVWLHFWGKYISSPQEYNHPLICHMIDAAEICRALLDSDSFHSVFIKLLETINLDEPLAKAWILLLIANHDLGKCSIDFQMKKKDVIDKFIKNEEIHVKKTIESNFNHAAFGGMKFAQILDKFGVKIRERQLFNRIITGHHGYFDLNSDEYELDFREEWDGYREEIFNCLANLYNFPLEQLKNIKIYNKPVHGQILLGFLILSDWIASNSNLFSFLNQALDFHTPEDLQNYQNISSILAKKAVNDLGFSNQHSSLFPEPFNFQSIWSFEQFITLHPIQKICEEEDLQPGLLFIEAPMGEGKTEAAIYIAWKWMRDSCLGGIYIGLPTMATSDQMYGRFDKFLKQFKESTTSPLKLIHGMSDYIDLDKGMEWTQISSLESEMQSIAYDWFKPKRRAILSPFGVGTVDQIMMTVLAVKFGALRILGFSSKVIIIDEIHAYDAYMSTIIGRLLNWAGALNIPIILLSATLPSKKKLEFLKEYHDGIQVWNQNKINISLPKESNQKTYPLISSFSRAGLHEIPCKSYNPNKKYKIRLHSKGLSEPSYILDIAIKAYHQNLCVCILINNISYAQLVYKILREFSEFNQETMILFHARYQFSRRSEIQNQVLKMFDKSSCLSPDNPNSNPRPQGAILIATQVVEQSLDLDFDMMITEFAPIDLILQRIGRVKRHHRENRPKTTDPEIHILLPNIGEKSRKIIIPNRISWIYSRYILIRTLSILLQKAKSSRNLTISLPQDIRLLVEEVYSDEESEQIKKFEEFICMFYHVKKIEINWDNLHQKLTQKITNLKDKAKYFLLQEPNGKEFLGQETSKIVFDDNSENANGFLSAQTRDSDPRYRIILLNEIKDVILINKLNRKTAPEKKIQKQLIRLNVSVSDKWFKNVYPDEGYSELKETPNWLRGFHYLILKNDVWRGIDNKSRTIEFINDRYFGFMKIRT